VRSGPPRPFHGKKDGKIVIKNVKPKATGGKHEVIDKLFDGSSRLKETKEGETQEGKRI